jgi:signal transduction histidine kinase
VLDSWQQVLGAAAFWILFPLAWPLGDYARTRGLYVTALSDQAERAQRDREQQTQLEIAQERARIARDLHDVVAHGLTVIVRQAEAGEVRMPTDPDGARATFDTIAVAARQSLAEMRNLVTLLRVDEPTADNPSRQPQLGSFEELLDGVRRAGVQVTAHHDDLSDLPIGVRLTVYRLVQEALTNTLQHAGATQVDVQVRRRPDSLFTQVVDNGTSAGTPSRAGHGLIGLRERVAVYGGEFTAHAGPTSGFSVTADIPFINGHSE